MKHFVAIISCRHHCVKIASFNIKISFLFKAEEMYSLGTKEIECEAMEDRESGAPGLGL
jgi:hypothetical protein